MKPKISVFPKCFLQQLVVSRTMTLTEWIDLAATLGTDGLEFYSRFLPEDPALLKEAKARLSHHNLQAPMMCCSPDFTHPDPAVRRQEIEFEKKMIERTAFFGGKFCRVLSGQRHPEVTEEEGLSLAVE